MRRDRTAGFSGWRIVAFAALGLAMTAPGQTIGVSVFIDPMLADLDLTRSQLSGAYLVGTLLGALTLPVTGRALDRMGVRRLMTVVGVGFGIALAGMAGVAGLVSLGLGFTGIRMLGQGALSLVSTTSVALWFDRRRGLALGVCTAVGVALMSLAPVLLTRVITAVGWRTSWLLAAAAVWLVVLPIARFGMRDSPASVGQAVDGVRPQPGRRPPVRDGWTRSEALRTPMFWAVTLAVAASSMIGTALMFHQISLLGERGLTPVQAAANFLPQTAAVIVATLSMGWLIDRVQPRFLVLSAMVSLGLAMVLVQVAAPGWRAVAFALALGAANGAMRAQEAAVFPRYYGTAHLGAIRGLVMAASIGSTSLGPFALAVGFDTFGGYGPALNVLLVLPAAAAVLALVAPVPDAAALRRLRSSGAAPGTVGARDASAAHTATQEHGASQPPTAPAERPAPPSHD
jgi:MFS family permease